MKTSPSRVLLPTGTQAGASARPGELQQAVTQGSGHRQVRTRMLQLCAGAAWCCLAGPPSTELKTTTSPPSKSIPTKGALLVAVRLPLVSSRSTHTRALCRREKDWDSDDSNRSNHPANDYGSEEGPSADDEDDLDDFGQSKRRTHRGSDGFSDDYAAFGGGSSSDGGGSSSDEGVGWTRRMRAPPGTRFGAFDAGFDDMGMA